MSGLPKKEGRALKPSRFLCSEMRYAGREGRLVLTVSGRRYGTGGSAELGTAVYTG